MDTTRVRFVSLENIVFLRKADVMKLLLAFGALEAPDVQRRIKLLVANISTTGET